MRIKIGQLKRLIKEAASTIKVIREDYGDCEDCGGEKHMTCEECDGTGIVVSPDAPKRYQNPDLTIDEIPEKYQVTCETCDGEGVVDCETCDGTGIDPDLSAEELESIQTQQQADWDWACKRFFEKDK